MEIKGPQLFVDLNQWGDGWAFVFHLSLIHFKLEGMAMFGYLPFFLQC